MAARRFTSDQAHTALLDAGRALVAQHGLTAGLERIRLTDAIERSGVPRASAYRLFESKDSSAESAFHTELTLAIATTGPTTDLRIAGQAAQQLVDDAAPDSNATAPELTQYLAELIRVLASSIVNDGFSSPEASIYLTALASTQHAPENDRVRRALERTELALVDALIPPTRDTLDSFGLRLKPNTNYLSLASLIVTIVTGALLTRPTMASTTVELRVGTNAKSNPWTLLGIHLLSLIVMHTEPDPLRDATANLAELSFR